MINQSKRIMYQEKKLGIELHLYSTLNYTVCRSSRVVYMTAITLLLVSYFNQIKKVEIKSLLQDYWTLICTRT